MESFNNILRVLIVIFTNVVFLITIYYLVISFFGLIRKKDEKNLKIKRKFALVIAAHNEETVIKEAVDSLKRLKYPKDKYDIFIVADNCDDDTAKIAKDAGAIVYERFSESKRGKGYALEWMFDKIFKMDKGYDAVAIFDADNLVSSNFLLEMNKGLSKGYKVVQGYLDSKNPYDTWITGAYSISFWSANRMLQLSRSNLGLSCQLGGTGFCVDTGILKELGWGATCLTEDLEFSCKLVLNGYKVGWSHNAVVYDEKPLTLSQSWSQRKRWMQGFADVSSRYFFKLMKKAIKEFDIVAFDCALYSIQPIIIILLGITMILNLYNSIILMPSTMNNVINLIQNTNFTIGKIVSLLVILLQFIYVPFILILDKNLSLKSFWYYLILPLFSITWLPISIQGILNKNDKNWSHTIHTRTVKINELEKAN